MSHPLLVEAIESEFVPLLIHNNAGGKDAKILKQFNEPSWNNPVVRYLNSAGNDLIPRKDGVWDTGATTARIIDALRAAKRPVPEYLKLVASETKGRSEIATFAMSCFWQGEVELGALQGVKQTRAAWYGGKEVVDVAFDPQQVNFETLLKTARKLHCASTVFTHNSKQHEIARRLVGKEAIAVPKAEFSRPAKPSDQKYYLNHSALRYLPLTPMQTVRVNSALQKQRDYREHLSPRQQQLAQRILKAVKDNPNVLDGLKLADGPHNLYEYQQRLLARLGRG